MSMAEAVELGAEALLKRGPTLLTNASDAWKLRQWTDEVRANPNPNPYQCLRRVEAAPVDRRGES
jgi:hypothetical protein